MPLSIAAFSASDLIPFAAGINVHLNPDLKTDMNHLCLLILFLCSGHFLETHGQQSPVKKVLMEQKNHSDEVRAFAGTIKWLGQATVRFSYNGKIIYIDPLRLKSSETADLVLITHDHGDHLSPDDIAKIAGPKTQFIVAEVCREKLEQAGYKNIRTVIPGSKITVDGLEITAVPAYNIIKTDFHPKEKKYVGFLLNFGGITVYQTGDTERIPEMKDVRCDIILVPLGQTYTMNSVEEAAEAVLDTKASIAIPIHYALYEGTEEDAVKFGEILKKANITVLRGK